MPSRPVAVEKAELNNETKPPVVGIGASAGGLEAFTALLKALPLDTGMALVLIQHLDPEHESALAEILSRATKLPVHEIENNQRVRPNEVYVIPRNVSITIERGVLKTEKRPRRGLHRPIDTFFESLAKSQGTGAIGVVLSGTASDGTLGLEAIKAEGGITFAQDASAKHSSMPRSATASGAVDLVLPPDEIAKELARIAKHPFGFRAASSLDDTQEAARAEATAHAFDDSALPSGGNPKMPAKTGRGERAPAALDEDFKKILSLLHGHSGVDFSLYKSTTIRRRIARRMVLTKHDRPSEYIDFLEGDLAELDSLYSDVLISVTSFFRNAEAFEVLKKKVFPELLSHQSDKPLRCWVLGCSTGQEAYSIAMIFLEAAEENQSTRKIQIFATDLNDSLLNKAREGYYAATLAEDISPERLRRFFIAEKGGYRIIKALRELVVFARQNVNSDPPFSHVDFISCRNLLIYFEPALQRRVIPTFHYALSPNGYLILGGSETVGGFTDLFEPVDKKHRIYQRKAGIHPAIHLPPYLSGWNVPGAESRTRSVTKDEFTGADRTHPEFGAEREADRIALNRFSPPAVLINEQLQVIQFRGPTGMCLQPPVGKASFDLLKMAKEGLMLPLRSAIDEAKQSGQATSRAGVRVKQNGGWRNFNLEVFPLKGSGERGFLVFFQPLGDTPGSSQKRPTSKAPRAKKEEAERLEQMESELLETRAAFQSSQEQYEAANEVLQAGNEEIQSANEELQSVNEELETSKEELESANEELTTLNEEMNTRNAELSRANSDLLNFHNSVQIPIVVLASDNTVRRFNPPAAALFNLLPADIGRPIRHIQHNLLIPNESGHTFVDIYEIVASTTQTLKEISLEVRDQNGRWFSLLARPYLTLDNRVDGAVLLLVDIDQAKRNEAASAHLAGVVSSSPDAIVVTDTVGHITLWNDGARNLYGYTSEEAVGKRLSALFPDEHDGSSGQFLVSSSQGTPAQRPEIRRRRKDGQLIEVWLTASSIKNSAGEVIDVVEIGRDRSELRRIQRSLQESETRYRTIIDSVDEGFCIVEVKFNDTGKAVDYCFLDINLSFEKQTGIANAVGRWMKEIAPYHEQAWFDHFGDVAVTGEPQRFVLGATQLGNRIYDVYAFRFGEPDGRQVGVIFADVTAKNREEELNFQKQKIESIGVLAGGIAHDFNNLLMGIMGHASLIGSRKDVPEEARNSVEQIIKAGSQAADLTRQILDYAGKGRYLIESTNLSDLVNEILALVRSSVPREIQVELKLADELPDINCDRGQAKQVVMNLIINAVESMHGGGEQKVTVATSRETIGKYVPAGFHVAVEANPGDYVAFTVTDRGDGIASENLTRIFEPFFSTKGDGRGLGLAAMLGVMRGHGGSFRFSTKVGEGSTFQALFPVAISIGEKEEDRSPIGNMVASMDQRAILVADDEEAIRDIIKAVLERNGREVILAANGQEAIDIFRDRADDIGLVVLDLAMPLMSGEEALTAMREIRAGVPTVIMSGYAKEEVRKRFGESKNIRFLQKPFFLSELSKLTGE